MGQRHQIFAKGFINEKTEKTHVVGLHHQWLYGGTAIASLKNVVEFIKKNESNNPMKKNNYLYKEDFEKLMNMLYTLNPKKGYFYSRGLISLNKEAKEYNDLNSLEPEYQDCNDGQTFIDFTVGKKPMVGFVFPFNTEMEPEGGKKELQIQKWRVLSPREYVNLYYDLGTILQDKKHEWYSFVKEVESEIKYLERNTLQMTQEDFFKLYPQYESCFDYMKKEVLEVINEKKLA